MNRNDDDRTGIWIALAVMIWVMCNQEVKVSSALTWAVGWFVFRELIYLFAPLYQAMSQNARNRKRYRDSQPKSDPVPFWRWHYSKPNPDAEFNHFAGWFHENAFSMEALRVLFDHFINTGSEQYLHAPGAVCIEWGEYTRKQFYERYKYLVNHNEPDENALSEEALLDENFQQIFDQVRLRTSLYEIKHEANGEIFCTYLVQKL